MAHIAPTLRNTCACAVFIKLCSFRYKNPMIGKSAYRILAYRKTTDRVSVAVATLVLGVIITLLLRSQSTNLLSAYQIHNRINIVRMTVTFKHRLTLVAHTSLFCYPGRG